MTFRQKIQICTGGVISALCCWLAIRQIPLAEFSQTLGQARSVWLIPAILTFLLSTYIRSQRWRFLLKRQVSITNIFAAQSIGYLFTNVFPLGAGELARVFIISEQCKVPLTQVAPSAFIERVFDIIATVLMLILILPVFSPSALVLQAAFVLGLVALLLVLVIYLFVRHNCRAHTLFQLLHPKWTVRYTSRIFQMHENVVAGFSPLGSKLMIGKTLVYSLCSWLCTAVSYWSVIRMFQADGNFLEAAFFVISIAFALSIPSSPGFIGVFQYIGQQALVTPFGNKYSLATAFAIAFTSHLLYYLTTSLLGIIGLIYYGFSFRALKGYTQKAMRISVSMSSDGIVA